MDLQPLTVESDFMNPLVASGELLISGWRAGRWLMHPGMDAAGRAPLIVRAIKRVWVRFGVTQLTKTVV